MEILINDLTLIQNSNFTDAQFNVIVGNNGTGKTIFLETLVYLKKALGDYLSTQIRKHKNLDELVELDWKNEDLLKNLTDTNLNNSRIGYEDSFEFKINKENLNSFINKTIEEFNKEISKFILRDVLGDFANQNDVRLKISNLDYSSETSLKFVITKLEETRARIFVRKAAKRETMILNLVKDMQYEIDPLNKQDKTEIDIRPLMYSFDEIKEKINNFFRKCVLKLILDGPIFNEVAFFPTERSNVIDAKLNEIILNNPDSVNLRYSERIFNETYQEYNQITKRFKIPSILNSEAVLKMADGEYEYDENGEIIQIKQNDGRIIPRKLFSTKQNRIIPYLMLASPINNFELVIIEEPEAHLSIDSMKQLIPFFENILKAREQRLIISTHSEILLQMLNNTLLIDNSIKSNVYEFVNLENGRTTLKQANKSVYGYSTDLMTKGLDEVFEEANKIHERIAEDLENDF